MNRIYIIGNGFDLSHGLPTSYQDFIEFLIKKDFSNIIDNLPNRIYSKNLTHHLLGKLIIKDRRINEFNRLNAYIELGEYETNYFKNLKNEIFQNPLIAYQNIFDVNSVNAFIRNILDPNHLLWGKIEMQYFEILKRIYKSFMSNAIKYELAIKNVETLNENLEYIKNELVSYLKHIEEKNTNDYTQINLDKLLNEPINNKTAINYRRLENNFNFNISQNLFLNFNYTNTFSYLCEFELIKNKSKVINIHGNLNKPEDVIFGFGDENTNEYKEIENSEDVFLENIKSFKYLKNDNYDLLSNFIHGDFYEVYLLGHSCAVTDRVLLKKIFENTRCLSIKIVPRSGDEKIRFENYKEISFNIARIFDDNGLMRDKVIPYESCKISLPDIERFKVDVFDFLK